MSLQQAKGDHALKPPGQPWLELRPSPAAEGVLSFYYSEDEAAVPIRAILLPNNNKSDPNIETGTYGLFSTCSQGTRAGIVQRGTRYMFFLTNRGKGRMLTGYYHLRWYTRGNLPGRDFAVAADHAHFIDPGIPVGDLSVSILAHCTKRFRLSLRLDPDSTRVLLSLLNSRANEIARYLGEIDRIERRNMFLTGFRYVAWKRTDPFTWDDARLYIPGPRQSSSSAVAARRRMVSPSGKWKCSRCDRLIASKALLRICPSCTRSGTLVEYIESLSERGEAKPR